jgi:hypothetical protein
MTPGTALRRPKFVEFMNFERSSLCPRLYNAEREVCKLCSGTGKATGVPGLRHTPTLSGHEGILGRQFRKSEALSPN